MAWKRCSVGLAAQEGRNLELVVVDRPVLRRRPAVRIERALGRPIALRLRALGIFGVHRRGRGLRGLLAHRLRRRRLGGLVVVVVTAAETDRGKPLQQRHALVVTALHCSLVA